METSRDVHWNMVWIKHLFKHNEHVLKTCRVGAEYSSQAFSMNQVQNAASMANNMHGRSLLLKLHQSLQFYDQSFKQIVNENLSMISVIQQRAIHLHQEPEEQDITNDETVN